MICTRAGALMDSSILPSFHRASSSKYLGWGNAAHACLPMCAVDAETFHASSPVFEADHAWGAGALTLTKQHCHLESSRMITMLRLIDAVKGAAENDHRRGSAFHVRQTSRSLS